MVIIVSIAYRLLIIVTIGIFFLNLVYMNVQNKIAQNSLFLSKMFIIIKPPAKMKMEFIPTFWRMFC